VEAAATGQTRDVHDRSGHDPRSWGIEPGYDDVHGEWHHAPAATVRAVLEAMGGEPEEQPDGTVVARRPPPPVGDDVWVVRAGQQIDAGGLFTLICEDGAQHRGERVLPVDVPLGYHSLQLHQRGRTVQLIVSPGQCTPPPDDAWGWALQLYALRSAGSWGMGDLADLAEVARWSAGLGAEVIVVNPLHAALPVGGQQASPYYPASRVFRNPLYLRPELVEGARELDGLEAAVAAGRALSSCHLIDRDAVWGAKRPVLEAAFQRSAACGSAGLEAYREEVGPALDRWAAFCAACEVHGTDWRSWPARFATPEAAVPGVAADAALAGRASFHAWLQWQLDIQLAGAGRHGVGLVQDLAIGCDPSGADAWLWQDAFADGLRVGAPPDLFATDGQDWGLPPFDPWRLRTLAFSPFIDIVRAGFRHAGGLRVDHVMGLFRLFWIPVGRTAVDGCYVRYPWQELLDVLALESVRAGAFCVGEDLGTVEPWVREELAQRRVLSTRLLWFEEDPPGPSWPESSMAAVTTHDLPTVHGAWTGADVEDQRASGLAVAEGPVEELAGKLADWGGLDRSASPEEAVRVAHQLLASAPSTVVTATLDDALGVDRRPNLPGTMDDQRPNWRIPLPVLLEVIEQDPRVLEVARVLDGRSSGSPGERPGPPPAT
jgi:4-alpha-glucanotransferase